MFEQDTIFAAATPDAPASRAVIRVSGGRSRAAVQAILGDSIANRGVVRGRIATDLGEIPVLCYAASAPATATGEDTAEIHLPGSRFLITAVLHKLNDLPGLRFAAPGEFSRRAFLNGKLSLSQAEAVMALIGASGEAEARRASAMLDGGVSRQLGKLCDELEALCARMELSFDFDEEAAEQADESRFLAVAEELLSRFRRVIASPRASGAEAKVVVLAGIANAGKSALFNRLAGGTRAAVSAQSGTTRDAVRVRLAIQGVPIELVDTAGFKRADGSIERQAMERTRVEMSRADLVLHVIPADGASTEEATEIGQLLDQLPHERVLRVGSKSDLLSPGSLAQGDARAASIRCSAVTGDGIELLTQALARRLSTASAAEAPWVSERVRVHYLEAEDALATATQALSIDAPLEVASGLARTALSSIREALGRGASTDVLDYAFSNFCIGK